MTIENTMTTDEAAGAGGATRIRKRLPASVYVLAGGTFLMLTTEFVIAGILPEVAESLDVTLAQAGNLITIFALGMIIGAPLMTVLTRRLSKRLTLILALVAFVVGHVLVAVASDFTVILIARFVTAVATGAFWAVAAIVATRAAGPGSGARAMGVIGAGGSLATVLGVPAGAYISQVVGWRGTFWALAAAAGIVAILIAYIVPSDAPTTGSISLRSSMTGLLSGRLWLALLACLTTSGGVLAAYSFITPILAEQAGIPTAAVPLVLTGFGVGSLVGTILGGKFGDAHPGLITILVPSATTAVLLLIATFTGEPAGMVTLVVLLGLFGLSANGVLIHLAVHHAGPAAPLGSALSVSAFNAGTAITTPIAGAALASPLGIHGPSIIGALIMSLTLIPTITLAILRQRSKTTNARR